MFVVTLTFTAGSERAAPLMDGHNAWLRQGFEDGVFLLAGGLAGGQGGGLLAHNTSRAALEDRLRADPFVAEHIVDAEIIDITPGRTDDRLAFLKD